MDKVFIITKNDKPISLLYTTDDVIEFYKLHHNMSLTTYEVEYTPDMRENGLSGVNSDALKLENPYEVGHLVYTTNTWVSFKKTYAEAMQFLNQNQGVLSIRSIIVYQS